MILQRSTINGYYHKKSVQDYAEYGSLFKISNINACCAGEKKRLIFETPSRSCAALCGLA